MKNFEINLTEESMIESALNAYWNDAKLQLDNRGVYMTDGTKRPLGDIEKQQLEQRLELVEPIIRRLEQLY